MEFKLPPLPFKADALEPFISSRTIQVHYEKHHGGYVKKLNELVRGTSYERLPLEQIIIDAAGAEGEEKKIFNNAAQVWNHTFLWNCLRAPNTQHPSVELKTVLEQNFDGFDRFQEEFLKCGKDLFGSGYVWLVKNPDQTLALLPLEKAGNPLVEGKTPLMACDVWEHAYYLDYQNERERYLNSFWHLMNWEFIERNLSDNPYREFLHQSA